MATVADRILDLLAVGLVLDDDEIAARLGLNRVHVNQVCNSLAKKGEIVRGVGPRGKLVNRLPPTTRGVPTPPSQAATPLHAPAPPPPPRPAAQGGLLTEDEVKRALKEYLEGRGYGVIVAWGRERGIDIDAHRADGRLLIEAKGEAALPPQQVNYFLGAIGELIQRMTNPNAEYGLALPDNKQYRGLVSRLPRLARERFRLRVFLVSRTDAGYMVGELP